MFRADHCTIPIPAPLGQSPSPHHMGTVGSIFSTFVSLKLFQSKLQNTTLRKPPPQMEVRSCQSSARNLQWLSGSFRGKARVLAMDHRASARSLLSPSTTSNPVCYHLLTWGLKPVSYCLPHHAQLTPGSGPLHALFPLLRTLLESCMACCLTSFVSLPTLPSPSQRVPLGPPT